MTHATRKPLHGLGRSDRRTHDRRTPYADRDRLNSSEASTTPCREADSVVLVRQAMLAERSPLRA